ncbi:flagellar brake domain-containing protein [Maridesulfovibrio sp.]|uniref:flagellar brake domain-containing protein n=1 Tax=Maridesulfovibrio sp. TaxID=2795000 RepID=UPI003BA9D9F6
MVAGNTKFTVLSCGSFDNLGLQQGESVNIELFTTQERLWGEVVGFKSGVFLSVWLPALREREYQRILADDPDVTVRAKCKDCVICGFRSTVTRVMKYPYPILYLSYPESFEKVSLRKNERVECFQPVSIVYKGTELQGVFKDISKGGGRISFTLPDGNIFFNMGRELTADFSFKMNGDGPEISGSGVVRNMVSGSSNVSIGFKFIKFKSGTEGLLDQVIKSFSLHSGSV